MAVVKVIEIVATSTQSFDDAIKQGLKEASQTLRGVSGMEVKNQTIAVQDNQISEYRVTLHVAFTVEHKAG
jgi:flavin-binding protein dodecin